MITSMHHKNNIKIQNIDITQLLPYESYIKPHRIFTIPQSQIIKKISSVKDEFHNKILNKINELIE